MICPTPLVAHRSCIATSQKCSQDLARADNQNDAVGPVGWRLRQVEVHLHDEARDQAFRDVLVVVAEAEHLRVLDAVQAGVDRIRRQLLGTKRGDCPGVFSMAWLLRGLF